MGEQDIGDLEEIRLAIEGWLRSTLPDRRGLEITQLEFPKASGESSVTLILDTRGSEGGAQRVAFWAQIPLWHSTGLAGGHWTLVGHSLASSTHDPTEQVTVPSGHVCSGGHDTRLPLHEPSQHLMGYLGGHEEIMGHSFLFAWQLPSGHRTSDRAQARAVAEGHSVDEERQLPSD